MFSDLKPYPTYSDTKRSPWIPAFPASWAVVPGAGVLDEVRKKNSDLGESTVLSLSYGRVVVKPQAKLHGLVPASFEAYQVLQPGDIVIRPTDLQNDQTSLRVGAVQDRGIITSAYIGLRPRAISERYAVLYLKALDHLKVFYGMGSGLRQNLDFADFKRLPVPLPSLVEQEAIVTYLAHAQGRINDAIAIKRQLIRLLEEAKSVVARSALTVGVRVRSDRADNSNGLVDSIPPRWEVLPLKRLCRLKSGAGFPLAEQGRQGNSIPFFRVSDMTVTGNESRMQVVDSTVSREDARRMGAYVFPAGTVIFPKVGGALLTNKRRVLAMPSCVDNNIMGAELGPRLDDAFALEALKQLDLSLYVNPGPVPAIGEAQVGRIRIAVPPLGEQLEIAEYITQRTRAMDAEIQVARRELELLGQFRVRLMTDVVTGQVDVREIAANLRPVDAPEASAFDFADISDDENLVVYEMEEE